MISVKLNRRLPNEMVDIEIKKSIAFYTGKMMTYIISYNYKEPKTADVRKI
jgi:hypothetical protein